MMQKVVHDGDPHGYDETEPHPKTRVRSDGDVEILNPDGSVKSLQTRLRPGETPPRRSKQQWQGELASEDGYVSERRVPRIARVEKNDAPPPDERRMTERMTSAERKEYPIAEGLLDYFPDACAYVAHVSYLGNEKHNPGEKMHHARGKSTDHADCVGRHLSERGGYDTVVIGGVERKIRHTGALAWRAMALLQEELERELGLPLPRGARE
jgi:hypothetical protein